MKWVASVVNRGFRRVERSADRVIGCAGPLFIAIYVGLVGAGVWAFFGCVFPSLVTIPTALVRVWYLQSPVHIVLGLPMALYDSVRQQPYAMTQCVLVTLGCFYIASMMAWSYYMACMEPPGSVSEGMTEKLNERRYGPGSDVWWRHKCCQVSNAMLESASDAEDTSLFDATIPYADKSHSGLEAKGHQRVNQPGPPRFRYCKKCPQVTMTEAMLRLPPELRQVEKRNRRNHLLRVKQQEAHQTDVAHLHSNLAPELFVEVDDESETDVRAWLGEDQNNLVYAPKPERAHHCKTCKMCVLKFDHHCPWINQCVGLGNERYFILFMLWFALGTGIFGITGYRLVYKALWEYSWPFTYTPRVVFIMLYTTAVVMGIAVLILAVWHLYLVASGETSVESQDNAHYRSMAKERKEQFINVYDMGWARNLQIFFNTGRGLGYGYYTLLLPRRIEPYSDGWHFAKNPRLSGSHSGISREEEFTDDEGDDSLAVN